MHVINAYMDLHRKIRFHQVDMVTTVPRHVSKHKETPWRRIIDHSWGDIVDLAMSREKIYIYITCLRQISCSLARMDIHDLFARFTFHMATPMKFTVASFHHSPFKCVIPPAAAHERAPVHAEGGFVTFSLHCSKRTNIRISHTVIGRLVEIH